MDFIQRAIDKARTERGDATPAPETSERPERKRPAASAGRIEYTQTRSQKPRNDVLAGNRVIAGLDHDRRAESYRQLRTQVLHKLRDNGWHTLAVTSPNAHAGKSLTALNLAISLSMEVNQTVLLVDLDLRNPSLLDKLGLDAQHGLIDYLEGRAELKDVLINPGFERLVILPNLPGTAHRSELLTSPQMHALLDDIVSRYESRIIIFDLPAVLDDDDALLFAPHADALLMVVEDGVSKRSEIERALQLLKGKPLLGTVLNKAR
jgi:capsular exopolysaccharide synthesis family protein